MEQKYNEIRRPVYDKRSEIIKSIPDFWLTAVSNLSLLPLTTDLVDGVYSLAEWCWFVAVSESSCAW